MVDNHQIVLPLSEVINPWKDLQGSYRNLTLYKDISQFKEDQGYGSGPSINIKIKAPKEKHAEPKNHNNHAGNKRVTCSCSIDIDYIPPLMTFQCQPHFSRDWDRQR